MMQYKGYTSHVTFDDEANIFHGELMNIQDVITFQGQSVDELHRAFKDSIEDYLAFCAERNEEPNQPFSNKLIIPQHNILTNDNTMIEYNYTIIIQREEEGGYHAFCPLLRGCHSQGDTYEETLKNITEAIQLYIDSLKANFEPIPTEDFIIKPIRIAA